MSTLPIECIRFKSVRDSLGLTQSAFAEKLEIGNTTADIERGRTKLSGSLVMTLLKEYHINPLWLFGESEQRHLNPNYRDVTPKAISVDNIGQENILLVNEKAAAGYAGNLGDPEYYQNLPAFSFPLPEYRNASFRGFQVEGDSMMPAIKPSEWVLTKAIVNINEIVNGRVYVVVDEEGIRIKKVIKNDNQTLSLISINTDYPPVIIGFHEVKELWEYHSKITTDINEEVAFEKLESIHDDIKKIKERLGE